MLSNDTSETNFSTQYEIAHLHCTTPALAGGARERSAVQVSGEYALAVTN